MFDDQLAVEMSRGRGLGLAEMMTQQLLRSGAGIADGAPSAAVPVASRGCRGEARRGRGGLGRDGRRG